MSAFSSNRQLQPTASRAGPRQSGIKCSGPHHNTTAIVAANLAAMLLEATAPSPLLKKAMSAPTFRNLFVSRLPADMDDAGLAALFAGLGAVQANVIRHDPRQGGRSKGFGFVRFATEAQGKAAHQAVLRRRAAGEIAIQAYPSQSPPSDEPATCAGIHNQEKAHNTTPAEGMAPADGQSDGSHEPHALRSPSLLRYPFSPDTAASASSTSIRVVIPVHGNQQDMPAAAVAATTTVATVVPPKSPHTDCWYRHNPYAPEHREYLCA